MMFRPPKTEIQAETNIVILNFALDTRSFFSRIRSNIYKFFSEFGQLKDAKLYDLVALSEKLAADPDYIQLLISKLPLSADEQSDFKLYKAVVKSIHQASKIYIMGHCSEGAPYLISDSEVKTPVHLIKCFFPENMQNKNIDIVACKSNIFTELLAEDLKEQANGINCNGVTLSSKTYITIPLPNGECYFYKMNDSGLPEIFKTGKNYRKEFLITNNNDYIFSDISNESEAADFEELVGSYREKQKYKFG